MFDVGRVDHGFEAGDAQLRLLEDSVTDITPGQSKRPGERLENYPGNCFPDSRNFLTIEPLLPISSGSQAADISLVKTQDTARREEQHLEQQAVLAAGTDAPEMAVAIAGGEAGEPRGDVQEPADENRPLEQDRVRLLRLLRGLFERFDADRDGFLTTDEIKAGMLNANTSRDEAVLLSSLWLRYENLAALSDDQQGAETLLHQQDIMFLCQALEQEEAGPPLSEAQTSALRRLRTSIWFYNGTLDDWPMRLYANTNNLTASIVPAACLQPMEVGNCYFAAALASLASANPQAIRNMIRDNNDGTYTVTFPGQNPITVQAPTAGELLWYHVGSSHGYWAVVLQKAHGQLQNPQANYALEGGNGGSTSNQGLRILTGGSVDVDDNWCTSYATMNQWLETSLCAGRPITASISNEFGALFGLADNREDTSGLPCGHAYAVLSFQSNYTNPQEAIITLYNPHASNNWLNGAPPDGVTCLGNGVFRMNLRTFNSIFSRIAYALQAPGS